MSKKLKPILVIAGPGAGKTHYLVEKICESLPSLESHRFLAVITYTNTATSEIRERLSKKIDIPQNVFIGTIHSFLIRFILKPFGSIYGVLPNNPIYKEVNVNAKDKKEEHIIKSQIVKKGVVPYEKIISLSKNLMKDYEKVRALVSERLQYLFVDEFQDIDSGQYEIFESIRKQQKTKMYFVGDPEQSIMTFRNNGRKKPLNKRPIYEAMQFKMIEKKFLYNNHRSSVTIIDFLNKFHTSLKQVKSNEEIDSQNKVVFIDAQDIRKIIEEFNRLCNDQKYCRNRPKSRFFLGFKGDTYTKVENEYGLIQKESNESNQPKFIEETSHFITKLLNTNQNNIISYMGIDDLQYRMLCLSVIDIIKQNPFISSKSLIDYIKVIFKGDPYKTIHNKIQHKPDELAEEFIKQINSELQGRFNLQKTEDYHLTIHKSKGLQADAVLVIARSKKELMKWLETDVEARLTDKQDTCRVGYVAFSRAKEFLCIACLEKVDSELREHMIKLDIEIVPLAEKLLKV